MQSLPTIQSANLSAYWEVVRKLEPDFYLLRVALEETQVNPMVLPKVVRAIANLAIGTGFGKVEIYMQEKKITQINNMESF